MSLREIMPAQADLATRVALLHMNTVSSPRTLAIVVVLLITNWCRALQVSQLH